MTYLYSHTINNANYDGFTISGRYSCIGKQLGLMEVRYMTAQIVRKYDVALASDQNPKDWVDGKRDTFTLALASLNLVFTRRKDVA